MKYSREQILIYVNMRVPDFTPERKDEIVTTALAVLADSKYAMFADQPMVAVKIAIGRLLV